MLLTIEYRSIFTSIMPRSRRLYGIDLDRAEWTQGEVLKFTGLVPATLQNWVNRGLISPKIKNPGKAQRRFYAPIEVLKLRTVASLTAIGITPAVAVEVVTHCLDERIADLIAREDLRAKEGEAAVPFGGHASYVITFRNGRREANLVKGSKAHMDLALAKGFSPGDVRIEIEIDEIIYRVLRLMQDKHSEELRPFEEGPIVDTE